MRRLAPAAHDCPFFILHPSHLADAELLFLAEAIGTLRPGELHRGGLSKTFDPEINKSCSKLGGKKCIQAAEESWK
ncbi:hypothetical protein GHT09_015865 [Marmota monax]|uniref:Uncharacterized protein n=1 Tax=Marmota monax TaxID=9995 RepID=A0A834UV11_MARMO|nr:hypothetical protein GHT09_015865 [Marmota monax]